MDFLLEIQEWLKERSSVSQKRERNFSSQNDKLFISAIAKRGSNGTGFTAGLSDGSSFFVSGIFLEDNDIVINKLVDSDLLEMLEIESDSIKAFLKTVNLIRRSEQSSGGLYIKLKKKGFSESACRDAISKAESSGLLNDERFAEMWISSRLRRHPEGKSMIIAGLVSRGVSGSIAALTVEKYLIEEDLQEAVLAAGKKLAVKFKNSPQKLQNALYRRGFTIRDINYFLDNVKVKKDQL